MKNLSCALCATVFMLGLGQSGAQQRPSYGQAVSLETGKKIAAASIAAARRNNWNVAVAILDNHGMLTYYEMMGDTQTSSANIAKENGRNAAMLRRPSKAFEEGISGGRTAILGLPGVTPIFIGGKIIGGVGVSGVNSDRMRRLHEPGWKR